MRSFALSLLLLTGSVCAQLPDRSPPLPGETERAKQDGRDSLIQAVRAAHGSEAEPVVDFQADVSVTPETTDQDSLTVRLRVRYLDSRRFGQFALNEDGQTVQMGRDRRGYWYRGKDQRVQALGDLDTETERQDIARYLSLCRQLIRFLDPSTMIEQMVEPSPIGSEQLKVGPHKTLACTSIEGRIESMPVYHRIRSETAEPAEGAEAGHPARVELLFDREDHRLVALRVTPLGMDGKPSGVAEAIRILSYSQQGGRLIPDKLAIAAEIVQDGRVVRQRVEIKLDEFRANSGFKPTDLDRAR